MSGQEERGVTTLPQTDDFEAKFQEAVNGRILHRLVDALVALETATREVVTLRERVAAARTFTVAQRREIDDLLERLERYRKRLDTISKCCGEPVTMDNITTIRAIAEGVHS